MKTEKLKQISELYDKIRLAEISVQQCEEYIIQIDKVPDNNFWVNQFRLDGNGILRDFCINGKYLSRYTIRVLILEMQTNANDELKRLLKKASKFDIKIKK